MKAYVLHSIGDLKYEDVEIPLLDKDTVLVNVKAAGICGSDIPRAYTTGTYSYPLIPGHEFSGIVEAIGENVDSKWIGKRVGIFPLIPCKKCVSCQKHQYEMCTSYSYLGSRTNGGFAEYVKVPVWNLISLPENISMEQAAMLEPMAVAVHAIRKANVKASDSVAVCGLGTIGLFIVMFLKELGCKNIYAIGNKDFQKTMIQELGIDEKYYFDSHMTDIGEQMEVDVFFDCVGKNETIIQGINCTAAGGTLQLVGNPASDMHFSKADFWKILRKQLNVYGTWNSSFDHDENDDWHYVLQRLQAGVINPEKMITHRFSIQDLYKGFEIMRDKTDNYIKLMGEK